MSRLPRRLLAVGVAAAAAAMALPAAAPAATGVVHVVTERSSSWGTVTELWYNRDGSGWRMHSWGRSGDTRWVADRRGITITTAAGSKGGPAGTDFISHARLLRGDESGRNYLTRPWADIAVDPLARVATGEMKIVGETVVDGRAAYDVVYTDGAMAHYFVAKDTGALLRVLPMPGSDAVDVRTYEVLQRDAATAARAKSKRHVGH
jgi:hypothetical protein